MKPSRSRFWGMFAAVTGAHVLLVVGLCLMPVLPGCAHKPPDLALPVKLIIEIPPEAGAVKAQEPPRPQAEPPKPPDPEPEAVAVKEVTPLPKKPEPKKPEPRKPEPKPPAPPKPPRKKIEVNKTLVRQKLPPPTTTRRPRLTPDEIARLLERGAQPGKRSSLSDDELKKILGTDKRFSNQGTEIGRDQLNLELIRQTMYRAWDQPSQLSDRGLSITVELTFQPDGTITANRVLRPSGNKAMDDSVLRAVRSVRRIQGLSPGFLNSRRTVSIAFELTGEG